MVKGGANPVVLDTLVEKAIEDSQVQPDWNENDETAKGYIKNKPGGYYTKGERVGGRLGDFSGGYHDYISFDSTLLQEKKSSLSVEMEIPGKGLFSARGSLDEFCDEKNFERLQITLGHHTGAPNNRTNYDISTLSPKITGEYCLLFRRCGYNSKRISKSFGC